MEIVPILLLTWGYLAVGHTASPVFHPQNRCVGPVLERSALTSYMVLYLICSKSVVLLRFGVYVFVLKLGQEKKWRIADGTGCSLYLIRISPSWWNVFQKYEFKTTCNRYSVFIHLCLQEAKQSGYLFFECQKYIFLFQTAPRLPVQELHPDCGQLGNIFITPIKYFVPIYNQSPFPFPGPNLVSVFIICLFWAFQINRIIQHVVFCAWLRSRGVTFWGFIHFAAHVITSFLFIAE